MLSLTVGDSASTRLTLSAEDGSEIPLGSVAKLSATSNRVKVATARIADGKVVVIGLSAGEANVRVSAGTGTASRLLPIIVEEAEHTPPTGAVGTRASRAPPSASRPVVSLVPDVDTIRLVVGEQDRLRVDAFDASHAVVADAGVRYLSLNQTLVQVDSISGEVSALSPGFATISATLRGTALAIGVQVRIEAPQLRLEADTFFVYPGVVDTLRLLPRSVQRPYRGPAVWSSSNAAAVRVEPGTGILTAITPGSATVSAQSSGWVVSTTVVVLAWEKLHVFQATSDSTMFLPLGGRAVLAGVGLGPTEHDTLHPLPVEWEVADTSVATVDRSDHRLVARKMGSTVLTARVRTIRPDRVPVAYHWPVRIVAGGLMLTPARIGLRVGGMDTLRVMMLDSLRRPIAMSAPVGWRVEPIGVVQQGGTGIFEASGIGRATISVRTSWDSTASATVLVAPDLAFVYGSRTAAGAVRSEVRGLDLRSAAIRSLGQASGREEQPAVSPDRTRILYTARAGAQQPDIWMMDVDGSNRVNLTADTLTDSSPAWSFDGTAIFFVKTRAGVGRLYQTDLSGTPARPLTDSTVRIQTVATSPDGKWLVYSTLRGEQYDLFRLPLRDGRPAGAEQAMVPSGDDEVLPRFAAATGDLYFLRKARRGTPGNILMRLKADAATPEPLTDRSIQVMDFAVAPDGDRVVVVAYRPQEKGREHRPALFLLDLRSGTPALGSPLVDDSAASYSSPAFTP